MGQDDTGLLLSFYRWSLAGAEFLLYNAIEGAHVPRNKGRAPTLRSGTVRAQDGLWTQRRVLWNSSSGRLNAQSRETWNREQEELRSFRPRSDTTLQKDSAPVETIKMSFRFQSTPNLKSMTILLSSPFQLICIKLWCLWGSIGKPDVSDPESLQSLSHRHAAV